MAVSGVVVVTRSIKIRRHQTYRIKAMLDAQRLAQLDASGLRNRVPLIRRLQWSSEKRFFLDRLLSEFRVNAATSKKQQPTYTEAPCRFDHIGLDLEVLQQKSAG